MQALAASTAALATYNAYSAAQNAVTSGGSWVSGSVTFGAANSDQRGEQSSQDFSAQRSTPDAT